MGKLFIIDLMPFLYKGHFVFLKNPRMTSTGINTSALLGLASGLQSILKREQPTHAVLAMDPGGPTFRHEAYPQYKAQREKMPEDLAASIPYAFELAEALRIPVVRVEGFEADDVMGTLAVKGAAAGFDVTMYERNPVIAALLRDALERTSDEPALADIVTHMHLVEGESTAALPHLAFPPDVVLLDPMFPEKRKDGAAKKKLQMLQKLEQPCNDEQALLEAALSAHPMKVIVKRPVKGPHLAGRKPSYSLSGKAIRYDCYLPE